MSDPVSSEEWRQILMGEVRGLRTAQSLWKKIPSEPRCKLCYAPFGKPGNFLIRVFGGKPSPLNRRLCTWCIKSAHKHPGGAEVEISALFADIRGSTGLAEQLPPSEFGQLLTRFWGTAARVVDRWDGIVDKFVGDEAVALFIPGFAGEDHAARAVKAARELLLETGHGEGEAWVPVGDRRPHGPLLRRLHRRGRRARLHRPRRHGQHRRPADLDGEDGRDRHQRRGGGAAELDTSGLERRTLELRGREQTVDAWVQPAMSSVETTAA